MTALNLAIPSKGRLQEQTLAFLADAGLHLSQSRGNRDYTAGLKGVDDVIVSLLSAAEIADELRAGRVHFGISGEDLLHEHGAAGQTHVVEKLGFGRADVVVAVPRAWIDVSTMADLDDVASAFHLRHHRRLRIATKYLNLTRSFFAGHGIADYRIVESLGATEGAPAAGSAELIVDITTTGATLAANGLRVLDDGVMLRSQANLVASRTANWGTAERETVRMILDRIAAQARAKAFRELRTRFAGCDNALLEELKTSFGVEAPFGGPTSSGMLTLHCPPKHIAALATVLRQRGAETVSVSGLDYVFGRDNPLYAKLEAGLER
jgi:ATP phosphoribosyltransferase